MSRSRKAHKGDRRSVPTEIAGAEGTPGAEQPDAPRPEQVDLLDGIEMTARSGVEPHVTVDPAGPEDDSVDPVGPEDLGPLPTALDESLSQIGELEDQGVYDLALEQLVALEADQPESPVVLARMGSVLGSLGRFGEAESALDRAHRMSPDDVDIRAGIGILEFKRGLYDRAEAALRWVCDRQPDHGPAHLYRGEALDRLGRIDEAMVVLERALELDPDNPKVYQALGMIYDKRREPDEAARMYQMARELGRR